MRAGAITAAVTGSDFLISYLKGSAATNGTYGNGSGRVKVICLSHKVLVYFTNDPKTRLWLYPGQMSDIQIATKNMPPVVTINHGSLLASSMLGEKGGFGPLPSQALLELIASKQARNSVPENNFQTGGEVNNSAPSNDPMTEEVNLQTEAVQTAQLDTASSNGNMENKGNSGKKGNNGNKGNMENKGNNGNKGNMENKGNSGNMENKGNNGNKGNMENKGNNGNKGNMENRRNIGNRGNSGNNGTARAQANAQRTGR